MSYNQIRSAGNHRKAMNNHRKPLAHRKTNSSSWSHQPHHHYGPGTRVPSNFGSGQEISSFQGRSVSYPPVQALTETNRSHPYTEFHNSGSSSDNHHVCQVIKRSDNRGYLVQDANNQRPLSLSSTNTRYTYPPVQGNNRPRCYTDFHGSDPSRLSDTLICQPVHRTDNRGYTVQDSSKRAKTEYGYFATNHDSLPPLPPPHNPNGVSPFGLHNYQETNGTNVEGLSAVVSETFHDDSSINSSTEHPRLLALPEDKSHLTALHCFVRRHCVYIFCAEAHEVDSKFSIVNTPWSLLSICSHFFCIAFYSTPQREEEATFTWPDWYWLCLLQRFIHQTQGMLLLSKLHQRYLQRNDDHSTTPFSSLSVCNEVS
jgi:hypothetical protein